MRVAPPRNEEIPGLFIPTVEGGLLCQQEMSREAARRQLRCPPVLSLSWPSSAGAWAAECVRAGQYEAVVDAVVAALDQLRAGGATFVAITANLLHLVFEPVQARSPLPMISIVDVVAAAAARCGCGAVGLLGTLPIMQSDLYPRALARANIQVLTPDAEDRDWVNRTVFSELLAGIVTPESRNRMQCVARNLQARGAQAMALCCTELGMVLDDSPDLPVLDSTKLLAHAVLERSLAGIVA